MRKKKKSKGQSTKYIISMEKKEEPFDFSPFVPLELAQILGLNKQKPGMEGLLEEQKELEACVMNMNICGFSERMNQMDVKEAYKLINYAMEEMIPLIYEKKGLINEFKGAGATSLFLNSCKDGLDATIGLLEKMWIQENEIYKEFSAAMTYGSIMIGNVGHEKRMSVLTLSVYTGLAEYLQNVGRSINARLLVTGSLVANIDDFERKYNQRFLGFVYISANNSIEKLYDVFDGDDVESRTRKRKTRTVFEKGVDLFLKRDFEEARMNFIEVIKTDKEDLAAKTYRKICDRHLQLKDKKEADIFLLRY